MHDYYAERLGYGRHRSQLQSMCCPPQPIYYDDFGERVLAMQLAKTLQPRKYDSEVDSDDENDVDKAISAHVRATIEYETIKGKYDDAKKKVDECAAKVKAAKRRAKKDRTISMGADFHMCQKLSAPRVSRVHMRVQNEFIRAETFQRPNCRKENKGQFFVAVTMSIDDSGNAASFGDPPARRVLHHQPSVAEDESPCQGKTLLRAKSSGDDLDQRQLPTGDWRTSRYRNDGNDGDGSSSSAAPTVGGGSGKNNRANTVHVNGGLHCVQALQRVIVFRVLPRYAESEAQPSDMRTIYLEYVVRLIEDGFRETSELRLNSSHVTMLKKIVSLSKINSIATFEPLPEHNESHVGPYGVEVPLHWDFVVKVTEFTVAVKVDTVKESCSNADQAVNLPGEVFVRPKHD
ncbi:uncharacterized protein M421DRAFT_93572 [Didymella exigua CBS 183.55]|uniref:Uncharacterized protein n=1 Tax=Didymella exigua CBS 183.55 TaxID=1150837 RepID=A0A6A5RIS5_9PLEO|nr:uncharacterized protein M421DRAFT_93572 [Didymella exigua CBS 183.55]KAF1926998.1 hypothetical protein M421DRAFT_93572 [Didymella exigua CBS 183.55]